MPTPVTDPNVLAQLEGGGGNVPAGGRPVTDPNVLAQLEGGGAEQRPFLEKLGSFARNVYANPPPTIAAARDVIKGAPAAAQELTWGADPAAAEQAAGTMTGAAGMGLGFRGLGGEGVAARPIARPGTVAIPTLPPLFPREAGPSVSQQAVEAAGRGGYTLPGYVATEGTVVPQVASSLKNVPWGGQPIVRSHDELLAAMGRSAGEIAPAAGTPETAGARAKTGLTSFIETGSQKPVSEAYKAVDALIDPEVRVPLDNTREMIGQIMAERTAARIPGQSKAVQTVFDAVQDPRGMDYAGTKGLRSFLGEKTPLELASQGLAPTEVKRIYGALTKDLGAVIREAGTAPAPKQGTVRFYHGGDEAAAGPGGERWLTPDQKYAAGYADKTGGKVYYVDIAKDSPFLRKAYEDADTSQVAPYVSFNAPEKIAAGLKPLNDGGAAFSAWHQANRLAALTKAQQNALTKITGATGDAAPEAVFNRLVTFANSKAGGDLNRLQLARKAMGPEPWGAVGAALINRLGMAPDGTFSPQRFVTAFGNMAPAARNEVFSPQQHAALADLFTVSKHIQDRITRFGNPSGTARGGILGQAITGGALWAEPISTVTSLVGARLAAEALSRPAVVRAATQAARVSLSGNPVASARALAVLRAVATREGLMSAAPPPGNTRGMADGGRPDPGEPVLVGEQGPEMWVPDRPGTVVPDPYAAAAARTRRRYPTRTPDPVALAASQGGGAGWGQMLQGQAGGMLTLPERATRAAGELQRTGQYDPGPAVETSLLSMGMPMLAGGMMPGLAAAGMYYPRLYGAAQRNAIQQGMRAGTDPQTVR